MANYHFSILLILASFCKMKAIHSKGGEGMNQVGLVGRFTKDPVLRYLSGNRVQTHFSLAINRNFKNNHGEIDTDFISSSLQALITRKAISPLLAIKMLLIRFDIYTHYYL